LVIRLRIPGGQTTSRTLLALTEWADTLQLTSRGNLQLRGIDEQRLPALTDRVVELGLLPSASHELVRNIVASPLTSLTPDRPDVRPLIAALDQAICAEPELADLPGRFLFAIDDGSADVWSLAFDVGYRAIDPARGLLSLGSASGLSPAQAHGRLIPSSAAPAEMVQVATEFARARRGSKQAWRVWELSDFRRELGPPPTTGPEIGELPLPLGAVSGAASVGVPLSFLTSTQAAAVDDAARGGPVVITPWRTLIIPAAAGKLEALGTAGLITESDSPWSKITACVGAPCCAKSLIDTRKLAAEIARRPAGPARPVHVSGCERRCGAPVADHDEFVGT
jgi:precorrin-3B synthase